MKFDDFLEKVLDENNLTREQFRAEVDKRHALQLKYELRQLRKEAGFTQQQLAKELSVSPIRISQIENGSLEKINVSTLNRYLEVIGGKLTLGAKVRGKSVLLTSPVSKSLASR